MKNPNGPSIEQQEDWADALRDEDAKRVDRKTKIEQVVKQARKLCNDKDAIEQAWFRLCRELEFMCEPEAKNPRFNQLLHAVWIASSGDQT